MTNPFLNIGPKTESVLEKPQVKENNPFLEIGPSSRTFGVSNEGPEFTSGLSGESNDPFANIGPQNIDGNTGWWDNLAYGFSMGFGDTYRGVSQMLGQENALFTSKNLKDQQAELYQRMQDSENGIWTTLGYFGGAFLDPVTFVLPFMKAKNLYHAARLGAASGFFVGALGYVDDDFDSDIMPKFFTSTRPGQAILGAAGGAVISPAILKGSELLGKVKLPGGVLTPGDASVKAMNDSALKKVKILGKMGEKLETLKVRGDKDFEIQNYKKIIDEFKRDQIDNTSLLSPIRHFMNNYVVSGYREKGLIGAATKPISKELYDAIPESLQAIGGQKALQFVKGERTFTGSAGARVGPEVATGAVGSFISTQFTEEDTPALQKFMVGVLGFAAGAGGLGATRYIPAQRIIKTGGKTEKIKVTNFREMLAVGLIDNYGLPADVKKMKTAADAMGNHITGSTLRFVKKLELTSTDEQKLLLNLIEGDNVYGHVPKVYDELAKEARNIIKKSGQQLVDNGLISPEVYQKNINKYIRRVYKKDPAQLGKIGDELKSRGVHLTVTKKQYEQQFKNDIPFQIDAPNDPKLIEQYKDFRLNFPEKIGTPEYNKVVDELINKSRIKNHLGWEIFDIHADAGKNLTKNEKRTLSFNERETDEFKKAYTKLGDDEEITIRWELTKQERKGIEQIENASLGMAETGRILGGHLGRVGFYNKLASSADNPDPLKRFAFKDPSVSQIKELNLTKIPDSVIEGTKKYKFGNLAGLHINAEIADNLIRTQKYATQDPNKFFAAHRGLTQLWKVSKTAFNPTVHINNTFSNVILYDLVDGDNMIDNLRVAHRAITSEARKEQSELLDIAKNYGVLEAGLIENELKEISKFLTRNPYDKIKKSADELTQASGPAKVIFEDFVKSGAGLKTAADLATKLYRYEDQVFRIALLRDRLRKGYSVEDAAYDARRSFIDYDINAPVINWMRRSVTPFLAYSYRVLPLLAETAILRPWKYAKYAAMGNALNEAGVYFGGGDEEAERAVMPKRKEGSLFGVPFFPNRNIKLPATLDNNSVYIDITRWVPGGDVLDIGAFSGAEKLPGFVAPLQPSFGYLGDVVPALFGYDLFSEKKLSGTGGDIVLDWKMRGSKIMQNITPNFPFFPGSFTTERIDRARRGIPSAYRPPELEMGALFRGLGFKIEQADIAKLTTAKTIELRKELNAQKGALRNKAIDFKNKKITEEDYQKEAIERYTAIEKIISRYGKKFSKAASAQKKDPKKFIPGLLALPGEITIFGKKPFAKENPFLNVKPDINQQTDTLLKN